MDLPDWFEQLWGELRFKELVSQDTGTGFQRLFQHVMKAVDGEDFLDVRPVGKHGDFKCDGWSLQASTCYAVYGPFTRQNAAAVRRKLAADFNGAIRAWPDMRAWRLVHNDFAGLGAVVAAVLVSLREEAKIIAPNVAILPPWGPKDLSWLLRRTSTEARAAILGTHGWQLNRPSEFGAVGSDPVSASAGQSVAQLLDGFADGGLLDPLTASAFAGALAAFLLGDEAAFERRAGLLEQRCNDDPFEAMLTAVSFCVKATQTWELATGRTAEQLIEDWIKAESTVPYIAQIVLSARYGTEPGQSLPGHPDDQRRITMNLGMVTAMTLRLIADHRPYPLVAVLQDLLISIQREPSDPAGQTVVTQTLADVR